MNSEKNIKIKEDYSVMQYKSNEYSIVVGEYEGKKNQKLIIGDEKYVSNHVVFYDSAKISQAYNDALLLDANSIEDILQYVSKYGLPICDGDYVSLREDSNHLKNYIQGSRINICYTSDDFADINTLFYTRKAITLLQVLVDLQLDLHNYYFYSNESSELSVDNIISNIFHDLIRVMISFNYNCLRRSIERKAFSSYEFDFNSLAHKIIGIFQNPKNIEETVLQYLDTAFCTHSSLFVYKLFQKLDFNSKSLTLEPLLRNVLSGKGICQFSHGKIEIQPNSYVEVDSSFNTKQTLLLLKISEAAINICNKKNASINELFQQKQSEISLHDILENYNYPSYGPNRKSEICKEIYTIAEFFYFEIFTDLLSNCPPTVKLEYDTVIYSRQLPNLMQALLNKLYREAFIKYKICEGCGRAFPEALRRKDAEYCSETCSARFRKRNSREKQEKDNK